MSEYFESRLKFLKKSHKVLSHIKNTRQKSVNGIFHRYEQPVLTAAHVPLEWRFDMNPETNPQLLERFGINAVFNSGAIKFNDKYILVARVEGVDRKSFFAIAQSKNGVDGFEFLDQPIELPANGNGESNVYDMRLVQHADGWIYGLFCSEKRDPMAPEGDQSAAIAQCGIVRTKNLQNWERLADLQTPSAQQRNVVLHPEFVEHQYAFYTRPQDNFIEAGNGGGIAVGFCADINHPVIKNETVIDRKQYHTVYEAKNGLGPAPIKTSQGWLHLAHGVRNTAAGLRYVLYLFMTDLNDIRKIIYKPAGYFMAPEGNERTGDVGNVLFCNGWIIDDDGTVFIYYASSDTRMHVATASLSNLLDYVMNTAEDGFTSESSVHTIMELINKNKHLELYKKNGHVKKHHAV
jgi:4-O-beta-D-mannosyl-D-glucose phosphorylase